MGKESTPRTNYEEYVFVKKPYILQMRMAQSKDRLRAETWSEAVSRYLQ